MEHKSKSISLSLISQLFFVVLIMPFLPILITWQWRWWEAWAYAIVFILGFGVSRWLASQRHPDLMAERTRYKEHKNIESWDKRLLPWIGIMGVLLPLIAGLDARMGWSTGFSLTTKITALVLMVFGYVIGAYALIANKFFSAVVRIQSDRGHEVVSSGPYRWIRHPGYAGAILTYLTAPVLLEALWAFIPAGLMVLILVVRTYLEDKTLRQKLEGYEAYTQKVPYRLIRGIW